MKLIRIVLLLAFGFSSSLLYPQQQTSQVTAVTAVPHLVNFSGRVIDAQGKAVPGVSGITFSIYKEQFDGAPLWMETQNVQADAHGNYTVELGRARSEGLPLEVFSSGEGRWLGVRVQGQEEQSRVLLLSVPYALKAADAATIGGLPPSAFVLAAPPVAGGKAEGASSDSAQPGTVPPPALGGSGTGGQLSQWTGSGSSSTLGDSIVTQVGSGTSAKIGINQTSPSTTLDVKGAATVRGALNLPATGTATSSTGKSSEPVNLAASVFNSGTSTAVKQNFQWKTEPVGNNTSTATGSLNLLFGQGSASPTETGLNIANNGVINFAAGQTFPGTGPGTITGVTAGTGLNGGGTSGNVPVSLNTAFTDGRYPQLTAFNVFTNVQEFNNLVGIGVNPLFALHVNGTIRSETELSLGGTAPLLVDAPGIAGGHFAVLASGKVGIDNPSPAATLDVIGNVSASGPLTVGGNITGGGTLTVSGKVTGPNGAGLPIAYGFINADATVSKATSNVSSSWDSTNMRYVITITGVNYFFTSFVTLVTPTFSTSVPIVTADTGSVSGNLLVRLYNSAGTAIQNPFQFVIFAP